MPHPVWNSATRPDEQRSARARQQRAVSGKTGPLLVGEDRNEDHHHRDAANNVLQHPVVQHRKTFDRDRAADQKFPGPRRAHEEGISECRVAISQTLSASEAPPITASAIGSAKRLPLARRTAAQSIGGKAR